MSIRDELSFAMSVLNKGPINNPTHNDILKVAPHLDRNEAAEMLVAPFKSDQDIIRTFIGPPLHIRGAEHIYKLRLTPTRASQLTWDGCYRRKESYAATFLPPNHREEVYEYRERVSDYAESCYGEYLAWDKARWHVAFQLVDIQKTNDRGEMHLHFLEECFASFTSTFHEMEIMSDDRCPLLEQVNRTMQMVVLGRVAAAEVLGNVRPHQSLHCAECGGAINNNGCQFCQLKFTVKNLVVPQNDVTGWDVPLPLCIAEGVHREHKFKLDPLNATKDYYLRWAVKGLTQVCRIPEERQRIITLRDEPKHAT